MIVELYLKQFFTNLTIGVRKRELMYGVMPLCSLLYAAAPEQAQYYLHILIYLSLLVTIGLVLFKGIPSLLRDGISERKRYPIEIPELQELAKKNKLKLSSQPFWEIDKKIIKARALGDSKKTSMIVFGKEYLSSLTTSEERMFVGGHEFYHLYGHELFYYLITFIPTFTFLIWVPLTLHVPDDIIGIGAFGGIVGWFCFSKRSFESIADLYGAKNVSKESAISALEKAYEGKTHIKFYTHPSVVERVRNLDKYYLQRK